MVQSGVVSQPFDMPSGPLVVEAMAVARGGVILLSGLSFTLKPGEALLCRGPNGAGKTTLLRTLAGLQSPAAGRVAQNTDSMAYASHADGVKATLSVRENLMFWARVYGHSEISEALEDFALTDLQDRLAGTLSAGQKRRLGLARLPLTRRPIWLLDEPTVSLDQRAVSFFAATVRKHLVRGGSAMIATHIDLGLDEARILDLGDYRSVGHPADPDAAADGAARPRARSGAHDAFASDDDAEAYL